jgi:hypothetical protein
VKPIAPITPLGNCLYIIMKGGDFMWDEDDEAPEATQEESNDGPDEDVHSDDWNNDQKGTDENE